MSVYVIPAGLGPFCDRRGGVMTLARRSSCLAVQLTMTQHVHIHLPSAAAPRCVAESTRGPRRPTCSICSCLAARQQAAQPLRLRLTVPASTFRPRRSGAVEWRRSGTGSSVYRCCLSALSLTYTSALDSSRSGSLHTAAARVTCAAHPPRNIAGECLCSGYYSSRQLC